MEISVVFDEKFEFSLQNNLAVGYRVYTVDWSRH